MVRCFGFDPDRRKVMKKGGILIASAVVFQGDGGIALAASKGREEKLEKKDEDVSPAEDLMREHGALDRMLLIYDEISIRLENGVKYPPEVLTGTASLIRRFVEDYHERLEEDYLFPQFKKTGKLVDLVNTLLGQHQAGRRLTEKITNIASLAAPDGNEKKELTKYLRFFSRMYRPHKSREDTVLFPAFHSMLSPQEYDSLGEKFEDKENELFGENGFEKVVERVAGMEKALGIYELSQFTPPV